MRREVLRLVGLVLLVDAVFIGCYCVAGLARASVRVTFGYMVVWIVVTLAVVLRGLGRVRVARLRLMRGS